jgi:hypothetical protein
MRLLQNFSFATATAEKRSFVELQSGKQQKAEHFANTCSILIIIIALFVNAGFNSNPLVM